MKIILVQLLLLSGLIATSQGIPKGAEKLLSQQERHKIDSIKQIDWLSYDYKYLDKEYKINVPHTVFQKGLDDGKFIRERIIKYSDSLSVVLFIELEDNVAVRMAGLRINYSWERLSWNLLMTIEESQELAADLGFNLPYRVKEYLEDESITAVKRKQILSDLRKRVAQLEQVTEDVDQLSLKELFNRAFRYSPARLKKVRAIQAERKAMKEKKQ